MNVVIKHTLIIVGICLFHFRTDVVESSSSPVKVFATSPSKTIESISPQPIQMLIKPGDKAPKRNVSTSRQQRHPLRIAGKDQKRVSRRQLPRNNSGDLKTAMAPPLFQRTISTPPLAERKRGSTKCITEGCTKRASYG